MNAKRKAVADRIERIEEEIRKAGEYLESGKHADWHGFRPLFSQRLKNGKEAPPHKDWVKNVFLRHAEKRLARAEKRLEKLEKEERALND